MISDGWKLEHWLCFKGATCVFVECFFTIAVQRYGWHGADDKQLQENFDNAVRTYAWLDGVRDRSVTELEFLHGHLNQPGVLPACICFRDKVRDRQTYRDS